MKEDDEEKKRQEDEEKKLHDDAEQGPISQEQKQAELEGILNSTEALTPQELDRKNAEDEKLKFELLGGGTTSIFEQKKLVADAKQPYVSLFPNSCEYYPVAFRLIGLPGDPKKYIKDRRVRNFTMDTVYARLPVEVLDELKKKNPFLIKILRRRYKLFQYLDADGRRMVEMFRDDAIDLGNDCKTFYEFAFRFAQTYGLPIQLRLYEEYKPNL